TPVFENQLPHVLIFPRGMKSHVNVQRANETIRQQQTARVFEVVIEVPVFVVEQAVAVRRRDWGDAVNRRPVNPTVQRTLGVKVDLKILEYQPVLRETERRQVTAITGRAGANRLQVQQSRVEEFTFADSREFERRSV